MANYRCSVCKKGGFATPDALANHERAKHRIGKQLDNGDRCEEQLRCQFPMAFTDEVNRELDVVSMRVLDAYELLRRALDELAALERRNKGDLLAIAPHLALVVERWRRRGIVRQPIGPVDLTDLIERVQAKVRGHRCGGDDDSAKFRAASRVFELVLDGCAEGSAERRVARDRAEREAKETMREKERGTYQARGGFALGGAAMPERRRGRS